MTDKEKLAEQYNAFCEAFGIVKPQAILEACVALDKIVEMVKAEATKWHYPSKGDLPDDNEIVLLSIKGRVWKRMEFGQWNGQFFVANDSDYSVSEIRAWMPVPEPPKEEA